MILFWFAVTQAVTFAVLELLTGAHAIIATRISTPLTAHTVRLLFGLVLSLAILVIGTGGLFMVARESGFAQLPSFSGIAFWMACILCSTFIVTLRSSRNR